MSKHWIPTWTWNTFFHWGMMCWLLTSRLVIMTCSPLHIKWPYSCNWFTCSAPLLNSWIFYPPTTDKWTLAFAYNVCNWSMHNLDRCYFINHCLKQLLNYSGLKKYLYLYIKNHGNWGFTLKEESHTYIYLR